MAGKTTTKIAAKKKTAKKSANVAKKALKRMRDLIHEADPEVVEEWKWKHEHRGIERNLTQARNAGRSKC